MAQARRFGLRAQILLSLLAVFVLSLGLLSSAALQLTRAASEREHARATEASIKALAITMGTTPSQAERDAALLDFAKRLGARASRIEPASGEPHGFGSPSSEPGIGVQLPGGDRWKVWPGEQTAGAYTPLARLLVFYVGLTGLVVLALTYFALTRSIVLPLDRLTRASEQLAERALEVHVPEEGAAEVARLAGSLNSMATQLRKQRRALEERLAQLEATTAELSTTHERLVHGEKLASVGRLAAGVAHEIGNPLAAILGLVELLRAGGIEPAERDEFMARIQKETERIHEIIRDLLDFARRDERIAEGESADVGEALLDAVNLVRPQKASREVAINLELAEGLPRVVGAQQRLTQVALNLLLNALDALGGHGRVRLHADRQGDECVVSVEDDGPGIAPHMLEHLFEPFTTTKPPGQGTGLGLAVSHTIVAQMGGRIEAANRPEGGARFTLRLKLAPS